MVVVTTDMYKSSVTINRSLRDMKTEAIIKSEPFFLLCPVHVKPFFFKYGDHT